MTRTSRLAIISAALAALVSSAHATDKVRLLTAAAAGVTGTAQAWDTPASGTFECWGAFGGTTVQLQRSPDSGTTWGNIAGASVTAAGTSVEGFSNIYMRAGQIRATTTGGTSPSVTCEFGRDEGGRTP
jgi:hypothetical protein